MEKVTLLGAFGAGVLSFITPCVLPLVPGYISFVSGVSIENLKGESRGSGSLGRVALSCFVFILGFSAVFVGLGASATLIGQFLIEKLAVLSKVAGVIVIIFGLHVAGVLKLPFLQFERRFHARTKPLGLVGSFFIGLAFAFGWTPCIGPILGTILLVASTKETVAEGISLLSAYSLGLGLPFFATGLAMNTFLGFAKSIRSHFRAIEIVSGVLLVAVGVLILTNSLQRLGFVLSTFD
ncbi:MAG: cytochrome c biogenesis protein CcdA [Candidatus Eisenbacteria bacterium]